MNDYKSTLNLPQTDFPMKANLAQRERATQSLGGDGLYGRMREAGKGQPTFILHDGLLCQRQAPCRACD